MEKADVSVLTLLADYCVLTVSQAAELCFVSEQAARRWIRRAEREGWITKHAGVLEADRGRPEAVVQLSEPGIALLAKRGDVKVGYAPMLRWGPDCSGTNCSLTRFGCSLAGLKMPT